MGKNLRRRLRLGVVLALLLGLFAAPAFAQRDKDKDKRWYAVKSLDQEKAWVQWIAAFLFTAGCVLIALKNPHRTHLD